MHMKNSKTSRGALGAVQQIKTTAIALALAVGALTVAAHADDGQADDRATNVKGRGIATMVATADDTVYGVFKQGDVFAANSFTIEGGVHPDGSANGSATFVFGEEFSTPWGADVITLKCAVDTGTVSEDGTIVLQGVSFEEDFVDGVVTFEELSPFKIVVHPEGLFSLRWCKLPTLDLEITKGQLKVK